MNTTHTRNMLLTVATGAVGAVVVAAAAADAPLESLSIAARHAPYVAAGGAGGNDG